MAGLVVCLLAFFAVASESACLTNTTYPDRLPYSVTPQSYLVNLTLSSPNDPNTTNRDQFYGVVTISLNILQDTNCITLHAGAQVILNAAQLSAPGLSLTPIAVTRDSDNEFVTFTFDQTLVTGLAATLRLDFTAAIQYDTLGLFVCDNDYTPSQQLTKNFGEILRKAPWGERKKPRKIHLSATGEKMFATQGEETGIRLIFPCFDEPFYKANFQFVIRVPTGQGLTVLNNADLGSKSTAGGFDVFNFVPIPQRMSSYLVALAVGHFDYVEKYSQGGVRLRVYTPVGYSSYGLFALNFSAQVLDWYSDLFNFPYSLMNKKLDQISVPGIDLDAMENWGLCTYAPDFLLANQYASSRDEVQIVAQVTAHEIFHQWYGDTLTNQWWSDLYLHEGFARLYEYIAVDHFFPQWYIWTTPENSVVGDTSFYTFAFNNGMNHDYQNTQPAVVVPQDQESSSAVFYPKGASINYMIRNYIGDSAWVKALSLHLSRFMWMNPTVDDLFSSFEAVGVDLSKQWASWLYQPGFPIVTLHIDSNNVVTVSQKPIATTLPSTQLWWVPLHVRATNGTQSDDYFVEFFSPNTSFTINQPGNWYLYGNFNYTAFVVADYDQAAQFNAVVNQLTDPNFPAVDKALLEDSLFYLANHP